MNNWNPIDSLAIMERTGEVLLCFPDGRIRIGVYAKYSDAGYPYVWQNQHGEVLCRPWKDDPEPCYWMPLPKQPDLAT